MCGLLGYAGLGSNVACLEAFRDLLWCSATRGKDGTGVATVQQTHLRNPYVQLSKRALSSANYIFESQRDKGGWYYRKTSDVVIAHCRDMTRGVRTDEDSHPFTFGNITGAHNGTLHGCPEYSEPGRSDSSQMFEDMSKRGVMQVLNDLNYYAAFAVSVWDNKEKKLFLSRNVDRPLTVAVGMDTSVIFWASEYRMLQAALERDGRLAKSKLGKFEYFDVTPNTVFEIKPEDIKKGDKSPWEIYQLRAKDKPKIDPRWGDWGDYGQDNKVTVRSITTGASKSTNPTKPPFDIPKFLQDHLDTEECTICGEPLEGPSFQYDPIWDGAKKKFACFGCEPNQIHNIPKERKDPVNYHKEEKIG
mgnify:CR=1 FL=1